MIDVCDDGDIAQFGGFHGRPLSTASAGRWKRSGRQASSPPMTPETLRQILEEAVPFNRFLGIRGLELEGGRVVLSLPFRAEFVGDPVKGALHGGVLSTLADTAGGMAIWSSLEEGARVSTIDLRVDYLRPGKLEIVYAEANVVRLGRHVGVADMRMFHPSEPDRSVATGKGVYAIRQGAKADVP